jgi:hypothetical protein
VIVAAGAVGPHHNTSDVLPTSLDAYYQALAAEQARTNGATGTNALQLRTAVAARCGSEAALQQTACQTGRNQWQVVITCALTLKMHFGRARFADVALPVRGLELGRGSGATKTAAYESASAEALQRFIVYTAAGVM